MLPRHLKHDNPKCFERKLLYFLVLEDSSPLVANILVVLVTCFKLDFYKIIEGKTELLRWDNT